MFTFLSQICDTNFKPDMHRSRAHFIYVTDCRRANANAHGTCKSCNLSRVLCLLQYRTQLILEVCFFNYFRQHKCSNTRNLGNDYTVFLLKDYIFIPKCLVYTPANISSSIFPPAFDNQQQRTFSHARKTRSKPQKLERF